MFKSSAIIVISYRVIKNEKWYVYYTNKLDSLSLRTMGTIIDENK